MNPEAPTRVMLVDDHMMVRRGLATFLRVYDDLELVGEASSGAEAIALCARLAPDVVLMDLLMPGMDGVMAIRAIREQFPQVAVLALTSFKEEALIQSALEAGAIGYLLKNISADDLARAIRAAQHDDLTLSPEVTRLLLQATNRPPAPGHDLTEREREVLALLVEGLNNTTIAAQLVVSPSTIKSHVSAILSKLGVASRTEAATLAVRRGLTPSPDE
jgi:two-component system, NarL family, response regulator LiaR